MGFIVDSSVPDTKPKTYEVCYIDGDTILYKAAATLQENYILVTHKKSGKGKEFKNVTEFYGRGKAKNRGWIEKTNLKRELDKKPLISHEDFEVELKARPITPPLGQTIIEYGLQSIDFTIGAIKKSMDAEDYVFMYGGGRCFRYDIAKIIPYKNERGDKPLFFNELREAFADKYRRKAVLIESDIETDDAISIEGWKSYANYRKAGKWSSVIAYVDKDLDQVLCPSLNYNRLEEGIRIPTVMDCAKAYCKQLLQGDTVDTIKGLPNISKEFGEKYNIAQRGIGEAIAEAILEGCDNPKELYGRVVEAYRSYYGEDEFDFEDYEGNITKRTWLDMLEENAQLLYMLRRKDEAGKFRLVDTLKRLGVVYE